jgi:hypothetical protein
LIGSVVIILFRRVSIVSNDISRLLLQPLLLVLGLFLGLFGTHGNKIVLLIITIVAIVERVLDYVRIITLHVILIELLKLRLIDCLIDMLVALFLECSKCTFMFLIVFLIVRTALVY